MCLSHFKLREQLLESRLVKQKATLLEGLKKHFTEIINISLGGEGSS